ncbi:hypothetical protein ACOMHN_013763 [Nucella lapillus]
MNKVTARLEVHIEQLESTLFDLKGEHDILVAEVKTLKEENKDLRNNLEQRVKEEGNMKRDMNDHEQHSRQFNVRVYGVPEVSGGTETVNDCVDRCLEVFSTKIGVPQGCVLAPVLFNLFFTCVLSHAVRDIEDGVYIRYVEAAPLKIKEAPAILTFFDNICSRFGFPKVVITDQGREFCNQL